jgi:hypothetical protein
MIACVLRSGGIYTPAHVRRLQAQCERFAPGEAFTCLSDVPIHGVDVRPLVHGWPGWWSKLELFRPSVFDVGTRVLYLDLDTTILGDIGDLLAQTAPFVALEDFYRRPPLVPFRGIASGLLQWTAGERGDIFEDFAANPDGIMRWAGHGGDQRVVERIMIGRATFWQDVVPDQVVSYKVHCRSGVPPAARVVCFHGYPKPWDPRVRLEARELLTCR